MTRKLIGTTLVIFLSAQVSLDAGMMQPKTLRVQHAKELLGKYYNSSIVSEGEKVKELKSYLTAWTTRSLKLAHKKYAGEIVEAVLVESKRHAFDPIFLLSMISNESTFNVTAVGSVGEIGLMQIRPSTAKWVSKKAGYHWGGRQTLFQPKTNIKIAAYYLSMLRRQFNGHAQLYVAAYNMGSKNVYRSLKARVFPKDYAQATMKYYIHYYTLLTSQEQGREVAQL